MERNWLIRTQHNQILGPISKLKVLEFIEKGSLSHQDEISSGNGYWFFVRERDLVDRFIRGEEVQGFNPISEAKTVLAYGEKTHRTLSINSVIAHNLDDANSTTTDITKVRTLESFQTVLNKSPDEGDLEFPDIEAIKKNIKVEDIQLHLSKNDEIKSEHVRDFKVATPSHKEEKGQILFPKQEDLDFPDLIKENSNSPVEHPDLELTLETNKLKASPVEHKSKLHEAKQDNKNTADKIQLSDRHSKLRSSALPIQNADKARDGKVDSRKLKRSDDEVVSTGSRNDLYLFFILLVLVIVMFGLFIYYYRFVLNKSLPI